MHLGAALLELINHVLLEVVVHYGQNKRSSGPTEHEGDVSGVTELTGASVSRSATNGASERRQRHRAPARLRDVRRHGEHGNRQETKNHLRFPREAAASALIAEHPVLFVTISSSVRDHLGCYRVDDAARARFSRHGRSQTSGNEFQACTVRRRRAGCTRTARTSTSDASEPYWNCFALQQHEDNFSSRLELISERSF